MRKKDVAVLFLCALAVLISFQSKGGYELKPTWHIPIDPSEFHNGHFPSDTEKLPPPVVTDIDGDGQNEIIYASADNKVYIFDPQSEDQTRDRQTILNDGTEADIPSAHFRADSIPELPVKKVASTLRSLGGTYGRRPIALATGYLDPLPEGGGQRRTQVIIVVTDGWSVLCYNHELRLMWESNPRSDMFSSYYLKEVAIMIASTPVRNGDRGIVVVGGRLAMSVDEPAIHEHWEETTVVDPGALILEREETADAIQEDDDGGDDDGNVDDDDTMDAHEEHTSIEKDEGHFSYYAFEGHTGALRWKHEEQDFLAASPHEFSEKHPEGDSHGEAEFPEDHAYKLHVYQNLQHLGEVSWREYKENMMNQLPHYWRSREDTQFRLEHFEKRRNVGGAAGGTFAPGAWSSEAMGLPEGHLHIPGIPLGGFAPHTEADHVKQANVIVAHLMDGIEVVHLYSGRMLCQIGLPANGGVYGDVNGDGIIDRIEAVATHDMLSELHRKNFQGESCFALASTGVPTFDYLWNGSICFPDSIFSKLFMRQFDARKERFQVEVTTPTLFPRGLTQDSVFLISSGRISSYRHDGSLNWQTTTGSAWLTKRQGVQELQRRTNRGTNTKIVRFLEMAAQPSLQTMALQTYGKQDCIIATGSREITLLEGETGRELSRVTLRQGVPISPPVIGDWNSDGLNDIVISTSSAIYGYELIKTSGSFLIPMLVIVLMVILLGLSATQTKRIQRLAKRADMAASRERSIYD